MTVASKNTVISWTLAIICLAAGVDIYLIARQIGGGILAALPLALLALCCFAATAINVAHGIGQDLPADWLKWLQWPSSLGQFGAAFCAGFHMVWEIGGKGTNFDAAMFWLIALIAIIALAGHDLMTTWNMIKQELSIIGKELRREAGNFAAETQAAEKASRASKPEEPREGSYERPLRF